MAKARAIAIFRLTPYRDTVFDIHGKALFSIDSVNAGWNHGFSDDGKYVFFNHNLVDVKTGQIIWAVREIGDFINIRGNYALITDRKFASVYSIATKEKVFSAPKTGELFWSYLGNKYLVALEILERGDRKSDVLQPSGLDMLNVYDYRKKRLLWSTKGTWPDSGVKHGIFYLTEDEKHIIMGDVTGLAFLDITGKTLWNLPTPNLNNRVPQYCEYSTSETGQFILA